MVAVLSLALGIGANTAIFGIIHSVSLTRLPVPAATELVQLQRALPGKGVDVRAAPQPMYFVPVADGDWPFLVMVVRRRGAARAVGHHVAQSIMAVAPGIGEGEPMLLSAAVNAALSRERISARLATLFGLVALCLAAIGLYGVLLYRVAERGREIGIRMALGADGMSVVGLVLRQSMRWQSMRLVGIGIAVGVPLALLAGRAVASQLYGVAPYSVAAAQPSDGIDRNTRERHA